MACKDTSWPLLAVMDQEMPNTWDIVGINKIPKTMKRILFAALLATVGFSGAYATQYYTIGGSPEVNCTTLGNTSCTSYPAPLYNEDHIQVTPPADELYFQ